jgi:hypothetical protein
MEEEEDDEEKERGEAWVSPIFLSFSRPPAVDRQNHAIITRL